MSIASIAPIVGAGVSGLLKSGAQGGSTTNQSGSSTSNQTVTPNEPDYFANFRQALIPQFQNELYKEQQPVYGDAQKASFVSNLNDLAHSSMSSIQNMLGASGATDAGRGETAMGDLEMKKFGKISDYMSQLPMLNEQARRSGISNLLGMGAGWTGKAPVGSTTEGSNTFDMNSTTTQQGAPWWKGLLNGILPGATNAVVNASSNKGLSF